MDFAIIALTAFIFAIIIVAQIALPKTKRVKEIRRFDLNLFLAALSYFGVLIIFSFIYYLVRRDAFVLFHLKQGLAIFALLLLSIFVAKYAELVGIIMFISFGIVAIFSMIQASRGFYYHLPFIGKLLE